MEAKVEVRARRSAPCGGVALAALRVTIAVAVVVASAAHVNAAGVAERDLRSAPLDEPVPVAHPGADEVLPVVPREGDATAQLERAGTLRREMSTPEPAARERARRAAVAAYQAVRLHFPEDSAACAQAAFRAGELLRAAHDRAAALAEFAIARERGARTPFRVRAMLEIGHVQRRAQDFPEALAAYEAVFAEESALPGQRDDAALWIGRVYCDTQRAEDARRTWQRVADGAEDPLDRIRAWDGIAGLSIATGDLEAAAGVIERCREALAEVSVEETRLGERVRNALAGMRSLDDLARAVAERARARDDDEGAAQKKTADRNLPLRSIDRL